MTTSDELERLARRASQEPWEVSGSSIQIHRGGTLFVSYRGNGKTDDAAFIAAANPATILALLSERAELLATVERMRGTIEMANNIANGYYTSYDFDAEDTVRRLIDVLSGEDK